MNVITTSMNPSTKLLTLTKDLISLFPKTKYFKRKKFKIRQIVYHLKVRKCKNLLVLKEESGLKRELWQINLKKKLVSRFEIVSSVLKKNLSTKGIQTFHDPELILNNFKGKVGNILGNMLGDLFSNKPDFIGRQVLTFHFEKGLIFVRFHRYIFSSSKNDVQIQELGPRLTLRFLTFHDSLLEKFFL